MGGKPPLFTADKTMCNISDFIFYKKNHDVESSSAAVRDQPLNAKAMPQTEAHRGVLGFITPKISYDVYKSPFIVMPYYYLKW
jgi:hypothetical protein